MTAARTIVITGASDGIGAAAARHLHAAGHTVVVVGRDPAKTARLADELGTTGHVADFARLDDVSRLAAELLAAHPRIDVLANNAGALHESYALTADGFERTVQVNHLAPYLLTRLLLGNVLAARGRVLWTSSAAVHTVRTLDPDAFGTPDPDARYRPLYAYAEAKAAGLLVMAELHRRFADRGLATAAFHPGLIASNFSADGDGIVGRFYRSRLKHLLAGPDAGARQLVHLAQDTTWEPGRYYERGRPARRTPPVLADAALARAVWARTEDLLASHVD
ncbi:short-chain dehydrogenase/reductase SDR [Xylanimonas cellulosilytica DSM 15894]|uniref:Short-chain dehydrogenase/reductase SDR n=1 Tax=Xylanimonas cellulosilytica (strain DSM 15894 / JCM 12276 / CECT 5975 / KCTC 9989 / LMG 20990 / NBRC 107835 / XIL07) TaxID=446471 RepID=D1BSY7_XYLCX|nr:SDR family NAD(P)-dependent oxidoreductase [Xylanimonas cellulosilytica]ACZ30829.1 short-chain dehydrogenase/reductase SDR [Xylanimonas cellulosilytica DSM 15894]